MKKNKYMFTLEKTYKKFSCSFSFLAKIPTGRTPAGTKYVTTIHYHFKCQSTF